jgi:ferredoxin like protein
LNIWGEGDRKLSFVKTKINRESHIKVNPEVCKNCPHQACTNVCPAICYRLIEGTVKFAHDGCLECGTCAVVCDQGAINWSYPTGGFGVAFRLS